MFHGWHCYAKQSKFTLSLADPLGRLRIELAWRLECPVFWVVSWSSWERLQNLLLHSIKIMSGLALTSSILFPRLLFWYLLTEWNPFKPAFWCEIHKHNIHLLGSKLLVSKKGEVLSQSSDTNMSSNPVRCALSDVTGAMFEFRIVHFSRWWSFTASLVRQPCAGSVQRENMQSIPRYHSRMWWNNTKLPSKSSWMLSTKGMEAPLVIFCFQFYHWLPMLPWVDVLMCWCCGPLPGKQR